MPNVIDLEEFDSRAAQPLTLPLPSARPLVAAVGSLLPCKRLDKFLQALALARLQEPNLFGLVVGQDRGVQAALEQQATALELLPHHLAFLGETDQVPALLSQCWMSLISNRWGPDMSVVEIDAKGMHYTPLNKLIRKAAADGADEIVLKNVMGQRFIGDGLTGHVRITVEGVPGGDLGMFMKGPTIIVKGNADHAPGNTMDEGLIVIHGSGGDATAHSMRGGRVYVRDDIGYRGGIHMKQYMDKRPVLVIGGNARAFLGEFMAGGLIILLRLGEEDPKPFAEMSDHELKAKRTSPNSILVASVPKRSYFGTASQLILTSHC